MEDTQGRTQKIKSEIMDSDELVLDDYDVNLDNSRQLVVEPNDLGILGSVIKAYDELSVESGQSGFVEFMIGDNDYSYVVTVRRVHKSKVDIDRASTPTVEVMDNDRVSDEDAKESYDEPLPKITIGEEIIQISTSDVEHKDDNDKIVIETVNDFDDSQIMEELQNDSLIESVEVTNEDDDLVSDDEELLNQQDDELSIDEENEYPTTDVSTDSEMLSSDLDSSNRPTDFKRRSKMIFKCEHCPFTTFRNDRLASHVSVKHGSDRDASSSVENETLDGVKEIVISDENISSVNMDTVKENHSNSPVSKKAIATKKSKAKPGKLKQKRVRKRNQALQEFLTLLNNGTEMIESFGNKTPLPGKDSENSKINRDSKEDHKCSFCDFTSHDRTKLYRHIGLTHAHNPNEHYTKGKLRTDCVFCPYKGINRKSLLLHLRTKHRGGKGYQCDQCDYKTHHKSNFDRHVEVVHDKKRDVKCSECGFLTTRNYLLEKHILYKHKGIKPYRCPEPGCDFGSTSSSNRKAHVMEVHKGLKPHVCSVVDCDFATSRKFILKNHLFKEHGIGEPPGGGVFNMNRGEEPGLSFPCPHCPHKASQKGNLQKHIRVKHLGQVKRYKCAKCEFSASEKCLVKTHISEVHLGQFRYSCELCNFKCSVRQRFERHFNAVHMCRRPYQCDSCDYKASQSIHLQRHIEVIHKGEKPHFCVFCKFNTAHRSNLRAHLKSIHKVSEQHLKEVLLSCVDLRVKKKRNKVSEKSAENTESQQFQTLTEPEFLKQEVVLITEGETSYDEEVKITSDEGHHQTAVVTIPSIPSNNVDDVDDLEALEASLVLEKIGQHQSLAIADTDSVSLAGIVAVQTVNLEQAPMTKLVHPIRAKVIQQQLPTSNAQKVYVAKQQFKKPVLPQHVRVVASSTEQIDSS